MSNLVGMLDKYFCPNEQQKKLVGMLDKYFCLNEQQKS
jgi:hypothetical protein